MTQSIEQNFSCAGFKRLNFAAADLKTNFNNKAGGTRRRAVYVPLMSMVENVEKSRGPQNASNLSRLVRGPFYKNLLIC